VSTRISHIPFFDRMLIPDWALFVAGTVYALPAAALLIWKPILGIIFVAAPICFLLMSHGPSAVYVLVAATFLFMPFSKAITILPADMAAFVLIAAYIIDLLTHGPASHGNRLARPLLIYVAMMLVSVAFNGFTDLSVRFFLRQVVLLGAFLAVAHFGRRVSARNVLILFVLAACANSFVSVTQFLMAGGGIRAFGLAGHGFGDHAMLALIIAVIFFWWTADIRARLLWGASALLILGALAATQTRASVITAGWCLAVALILALRLGRKYRCRIPLKNLVGAAALGLFIVPILIVYTPVFEGVAERFSRLGWHAAGTVILRKSLWSAALSAFWSYPILGIGAGNFAQVFQWLPGVKFDPVFSLVSGMSTHAVMMSALAETGILGFVSLCYFFGRTVLTAYRHMMASHSISEWPVTESLLIISLAVFGSSFYAGSWFWGSNSYHMAIVFGLIASHRYQSPVFLAGGRSL